MKFAKKGLLLLSMTTIIGIGTSKNVWATESMPVGDFPNTNVTTEESTESTVSGLTIVEENTESTESTESTEIIEGTEQPEENADISVYRKYLSGVGDPGDRCDYDEQL